MPTWSALAAENLLKSTHLSQRMVGGSIFEPSLTKLVFRLKVYYVGSIGRSLVLLCKL